MSQSPRDFCKTHANQECSTTVNFRIIAQFLSCFHIAAELLRECPHCSPVRRQHRKSYWLQIQKYSENFINDKDIINSKRSLHRTQTMTETWSNIYPHVCLINTYCTTTDKLALSRLVSRGFFYSNYQCNTAEKRLSVITIEQTKSWFKC